MFVSFNHLREFVDIPYTPSQLAERLTALGLEVREIKKVGALKGVFVGKVLRVKKHPNADRLKIVEVDLDREVLSFVCGAPNVREGEVVPVALEGAELPGNIKVRKAKIRGVVSPGMICSERELGLGEDHSGIMILPSHLPLGKSLSEALSLEDTVFDLEITSNRGDCLSILGIAREIASLTGSRVKLPLLKVEGEKKTLAEPLPEIKIKDFDLCPFYAARLVEEVEVAPSPLWLRWRIILYGGRPVNNIVDITNYVMWEMGQPLHPFDFDKIREGKIVVRRAKEGESLLTLDEKERILEEGMLVIADASFPIALAGIMGGKYTEVGDSTRDVLLEAAYFNPLSIRKTSRKLGIKSEASSRFEKGVDPAFVEKALDRTCLLIQKLGCGKVVGLSFKAGKPPLKKKIIYFRPSKVGKIIGVRVSSSTSEKILKGLGFGVKKEKKVWKVEVPSWRQDVEREIDLVEEVCRVYDYGKVKLTLPSLGLRGGREKTKERFEDILRNILKGCGFYEVVTNPLVGEELIKISNTPSKNALSLRNPLSTQQNLLRTYLFPRLIEVASFNYNQETKNFRIMEIGRVFSKEGEKLREFSSLCGLVVEDGFNFYKLKGIIEAVFEEVRVKEKVSFYPHSFSCLSEEEAAFIRVGEDDVGFLGKLNSAVCEDFKLPFGKSYLFELNLDFVVPLWGREKRFKPLPKFPCVRRDLSILIEENIPAEEIRKHVLKETLFVEEVEFFDVYKGPHIPEGFKSISFSLIFRHPERTLTDEEVNLLQDKIIKSLNKRWKASLRSK